MAAWPISWRISGCMVDQGRRALLDHLLMAALDGALAFAEVDHIAVTVAEDLDFDVAGALDQPLDVDFGAAEGALGFAGGVAESGFEVALAVHAAHAFPSAAGHRLQQDGVSVGRGERAQGVEA